MARYKQDYYHMPQTETGQQDSPGSRYNGFQQQNRAS